MRALVDALCILTINPFDLCVQLALIQNTTIHTLHLHKEN